MASTVVISGKSFEVPEEITYKQYRHITRLFQSLKIDFEKLVKAGKMNGDKINVAFQVSDVLEALMEQDKLPEFFATLLVPSEDLRDGKVWRETNIESYKTLMEDLGDRAFVSMLKDFLAGRTDLIVDFVSYLGTFMKENSLSLPSLNEEEKLVV
ncbi:MAG: hypothetical protein WC998_07765 [Candidatus Paceibacterota bacterium]|jgi:hypothetical protein